MTRRTIAALLLCSVALIASALALLSCGGSGAALGDALRQPGALLGTTPPWSMFGKDQLGHRRSQHPGPNTGAVKWTYKTGQGVSSSPAVASDGSLYFAGCEAGVNVKLYALSAAGQLKWMRDLWTWTAESSPQVWTSPAIAQDGTVYVCTKNTLEAFSPNGDHLWNHPYAGTNHCSPIIRQDGVIYSLNSFYGLHALNPDGSLLWRYDAEGQIGIGSAQWKAWTHSLSASADGTVYFGTERSSSSSPDPAILAVNANGTTRWSFTLPQTPEITQPLHGGVAKADGGVYYSTNRGVYSLDPQGQLDWYYSARIYTPLAQAVDGTLYVAANDCLQALNPNGTTKWSFSNKKLFSYAPYAPAVDGNGQIYFQAGGNIFAINSNGHQTWSASVLTKGKNYWGIGSIGAAPTIGGDGTIFVGSVDWKLYAFGPGTP